jgi:DNA-binding response OmpR family regulator
MKKNVLVIEDEPIIAEMISIILEEGGFNVISLDETGMARQKLHNQEVDIVMLDLNLVGEDGRSMCTYIKSQDSLKNIPVIFVSANDDIEKIMTDCGADDFIKKPFDIDAFCGKVNTHLPLST